ncbi:MAG: hypothetical protein AAFV43_03070 [Planctomycetota bacterium]
MSDSADEGFSAERVSELDALLTRHPELLGQYEQWMALLVTLDFEYSLNGEAFVSQTAESAGAYATTIENAGAALGPSETREKPRWKPGRGTWVLTLAASVVGVAGAWLLQPKSPSDGPAATMTESDRGDGGISPLSASWPQLRVASLSRSETTGLGGSNAPLWLDRFNSFPARGYLVPVPPGQQIEALVDASAEGPNELLIVELDSFGDPLRQATAFNNEPTGEEASETQRRRFGRIGRWTDYNSGVETRYYLFAGLHRLMQDSDHAVQRVSDFAVLINEGGIVHVGWDDSGVTAYPTWPEDASPPKDDYLVDRDYDDVCVSIRVYDPATAASPGVRALPASDALGAMPEETEGPYELVLAPHASLVMRFVHGSESDTKVAVADAETGQIVWRSDNTEVSRSARLRFNTDPGARDKNRGALYLENNTDNPRVYRIAACYRPDDASASNDWVASAHRALLKQPGYLIRGFQGGEADTSCLDLWVTVHWLTP